MFDGQFVRLFEQVVSSHRKIEPVREKLKSSGETIDLYRLLDEKGLGVVSASRLIEFLIKNGSVGTEVLYYLLKETKRRAD